MTSNNWPLVRLFCTEFISNELTQNPYLVFVMRSHQQLFKEVLYVPFIPSINHISSFFLGSWTLSVSKSRTSWLPHVDSCRQQDLTVPSRGIWTKSLWFCLYTLPSWFWDKTIKTWSKCRLSNLIQRFHKIMAFTV